MGIKIETILLVLTTAVSLEAIYLAIFIQMTVNRNTASLEEVEEDIDVIQEEVKGLGDDVEEIQEDLGEMTSEEAQEQQQEQQTKLLLENIDTELRHLMQDIEALKQQELQRKEQKLV